MFKSNTVLRETWEMVALQSELNEAATSEVSTVMPHGQADLSMLADRAGLARHT